MRKWKLTSRTSGTGMLWPPLRRRHLPSSPSKLKIPGKLAIYKWGNNPWTIVCSCRNWKMCLGCQSKGKVRGRSRQVWGTSRRNRLRTSINTTLRTPLSWVRSLKELSNLPKKYLILAAIFKILKFSELEFMSLTICPTWNLTPLKTLRTSSNKLST